MAGGAGGGGAVMQSTYVCVTCPGAADTNTGMPTNPVRTITRGIQLAVTLGRPTVFVGGQSGSTPVYSEDLTIPAGVTVQGRYVVSNGTWARTGNRTLLINTVASGVKFAAGATRTAGLDGLRVQSAGAVGGAADVTAIRVFNASPTLRDVQVDPATNSLPPPSTSAGISIAGGAGLLVRPSPLITASALAPSAVTAGPATTTSAGIAVTNAAPEIEFTDALGGTALNAGASSAGILLDGAVGTSVRDSTARSGASLACAGVASRGDASGIVLERIRAAGCLTAPGSGGPPPSQTVGIAFTGCPTGGLGATNPRVASSTARGGVAQGSNSFAVGVLAGNGCAPRIEDNPSLVGSEAVMIIPNLAAGVLCTHESRPGMSGANAACTVTNNRAGSTGDGISAGRGLTSFGVACIGNCASGSAVCPGSCAEVSGNSVEGGVAAASAHLWVSQSSPRIARNTLGSTNSTCGNGSSSVLIGLHLDGSASRVENNLVFGGECENVVGLEQVNVRRSGDNSTPAPDVHSNTILPVASTGGDSVTSIYGVLLRTQASSGPMVAAALRPYRNNIITALGSASARAAFRENDVQSDPLVLENNDFWTGTVSPGGQPPLYVNEGVNPPLTGAGQINNLGSSLPFSTSMNNLSQSPGLSIATFRLTPFSGLRGAGTFLFAPLDDIDGQPRSQPVGTPPDVGCDETN
ncbi:MAG: hypothetical protein INH37_19635 [Myxococcaceae bacterium]|nr:hypothetical protein [Myxococcaceae bacterium]